MILDILLVSIPFGVLGSICFICYLEHKEKMEKIKQKKKITPPPASRLP